ncbi:hypothetical protein G9A89_017786 [Geosiphon pyriformis]|nr:hypothetical protein G9A89_017786 [Geosiphon pyriformis]
MFLHSVRSFPALKFTCRWNGCLAPPFISGEEVYRHILYHHLPNKHIQSQQPENSILYDCNWMECRRFNPGTTNRGAVQAHLKIHFPIEPDAVPHPPSPYPVLVTPTPLDQRRNFLTYRTNISSDQDGEAIGIPLTACLILRNMSRSKKMAPYFVAYETELSDILVKCRPLSKYLAETMYNLRNLTV